MTTPIPSSSEVPTQPVATDPEDAPPVPRVRAGAMAWGVLLILTATTALAVLTEPDLRRTAIEWVLDLDASGLALLAVLATGVILLTVAGLALLRRAQLRAGRAP